MFLGWVIIIILQQGPSQIMPAGQVGRPPKESPPPSDPSSNSKKFKNVDHVETDRHRMKTGRKRRKRERECVCVCIFVCVCLCVF